MSTIKLAKELSDQGKKVLPIFWMATEDHDFDEINHFHVGEKTYRWESNQKGAVGEFQLAEMESFLSKIPNEFDWMKEFYQNSKTLAEATRKIVHHLYNEKGIIILDANDRALKSLFLDIAKKELQQNISSQEVEKTNDYLLSHDYKVQVNPREINLFYKKEGVRERIVKTAQGYALADSSKVWQEEEFISLIEQEPELISPNVILRPVYQQLILPNLGYIGGPGELIYWMQLKITHEAYGVHFPVLVPRDHIMYLTKTDERKRQRLSFSTQDLFEKKEVLRQRLIALSEHQIDVDELEQNILGSVNAVAKDLVSLDGSLSGFVEAEKVRLSKEVDRIRKKIRKAVERKEVKKMEDFELLFQRVAPHNSLQERRLNFLYYYQFDHTFLETIYKFIDPLNVSFKLIFDE